MKMEDLLSPELEVKWDEGLNSLLIINPNFAGPEGHMVRIRAETIQDMKFQEACTFIGQSVALLIPQFREMYIDPATGVVRPDGTPNIR